MRALPFLRRYGRYGQVAVFPAGPGLATSSRRIPAAPASFHQAIAPPRGLSGAASRRPDREGRPARSHTVSRAGSRRRRGRSGYAPSPRERRAPLAGAAPRRTRGPPANSPAARPARGTAPLSRTFARDRREPVRARANRRARARRGGARSHGRGRRAPRRWLRSQAGRRPRAIRSAPRAPTRGLRTRRFPRTESRACPAGTRACRRRDNRAVRRGRAGCRKPMRCPELPPWSDLQLDGDGAFLLAAEEARRAGAFRAAAAAAHVERVLGVLAVRAGDDEAILVVGYRHHPVHILDLRLTQTDLFQHGGIDAALDVLRALVGAHRQHAFQGAHHGRGVAGSE